MELVIIIFFNKKVEFVGPYLLFIEGKAIIGSICLYR